MAQENLTQNTVSNPTQAPQPPSYGGMDQVCSGPAGLLYSLSNELIMIYNELQDLYGKVAVAETNVQQSTVQAGAKAQTDAAYQQSLTIIGQAVEAGIGAAVSIGTMVAQTRSNSEINNKMTTAENELAPLKALEKLPKGAQPQVHMLGDAGILPPTEIGARTNALKTGTYDFNETPAAADINNQKAINNMSDQEFADFKMALNKRISEKETAVNTQQSRLNSNQQNISMYGQMATGAINGGVKGWESVTTAASGNAQATVQVANGVQGMANSTADSARGSIGQNYAKVSDVIASARQGANAYAQT